jgi:hypothetical protein
LRKAGAGDREKREAESRGEQSRPHVVDTHCSELLLSDR